MKTLSLLFVAASFASIALVRAADTRCYELRTYYAAPGKLDALNARFRNHTMQIFEKHGMKNIGYWMPIDNPDNKLIYVLEHPSRETADKAWKEFGADAEWQKVAKESEANGRLVTKVERRFMTATDYSPRSNPRSPVKRGCLNFALTPPRRITLKISTPAFASKPAHSSRSTAWRP